MSQGENYYMWDHCYWANKGQRGRMRSLFRSGSHHSNCSARYLYANSDVLNTATAYGGSFQALIVPQA